MSHWNKRVMVWDGYKDQDASYVTLCRRGETVSVTNFTLVVFMVFMFVLLQTYVQKTGLQIHPPSLKTSENLFNPSDANQLEFITQRHNVLSKSTRRPAKRILNTPVTSCNVTSSHVTSSHVTSYHVTSKLELNLKLKHIHVFVYNVSDWNTKIEKYYAKASARDTLNLVVRLTDSVRY